MNDRTTKRREHTRRTKNGRTHVREHQMRIRQSHKRILNEINRTDNIITQAKTSLEKQEQELEKLKGLDKEAYEESTLADEITNTQDALEEWDPDWVKDNLEGWRDDKLDEIEDE